MTNTGLGRSRTKQPRISGTFLVAFVVLIGLFVPPVGADPDSPTTSDPAAREKADRDKARARQNEIDGQLDVLKASDTQLKNEQLQLEVRLKEQETKTAQARVDRDAAQVHVEALNVELTIAEAEAKATRDVAKQRAIAAYMRPGGETVTQMLAARDPQELGEMQLIITEVARHDHDVWRSREAAENDLKSKRAEAEQAKVRADDLAAQADADLAQLVSLRDQKARVLEEIENRKSALQAESNALNEQEALLSSVILRRQAEAERATTTTTTTSTTTSTTIATTTTRGVPGVPTTVKPSTTSSTTTVSNPTTTVPGGPPRGSLSWPVNGPVTSPFGPRWGLFHKGIDIAADFNVSIRASDAGVVFFSGELGGYGNVILIDHGDGLVTLYAHQSSLKAVEDQRVARGEVIGLVGSTGHSTGPHLHFEVRINGTAVDPMPYLA